MNESIIEIALALDFYLMNPYFGNALALKFLPYTIFLDLG
jgi:hypothetical protein